MKVTNGPRRRGSLPSPPLQPLLIKDSIDRVRKDSKDSIDEEENGAEPRNEVGIVDPDEFVDSEEEEILVLFQQGENCDDDNQYSEEEQHSWSPSPIPEDVNVDENKEINTKRHSISSSILQPPVLEEENGKIKVTEKFMKDLIR